MNLHDLPDGRRVTVPPQSREAEQSLLGCLLLDGRCADQVADAVAASDFYLPEHQRIFSSVLSLAAANQPVDVVTVAEHLRARHHDEDFGGAAYLQALAQSVPSAANAKAYADVVRDRAMQRRIINALYDADEIAWGAGSAEEKLARIAEGFLKLERGPSQGVPRLIGELLPERVARLDDLAHGKLPPGIPVAIPPLDQALQGGLQAGRLYIVAARPSVGKSSLSLQMCAATARSGAPTLVLSQEMPTGEVVDRLLANAGRVDMGFLNTGSGEPDQFSRLSESSYQLSGLPLAIDDQPALTLARIKAKVRQMRGCQVLMLDYLRLCSGDDSKANRNTQIETISRGLKALAKSMNIAVIALSQLSRKCEDEKREPQMADLRDSGGIEQDADAILMLWPVRSMGESEHLIGAKLVKNRQGTKRRFGLHFIGAHQLWRESSESIERQDQRHQSRGGDL